LVIPPKTMIRST